MFFLIFLLKNNGLLSI